MKKTPSGELSLRKLLVAMLAVGPVAVLPAPLLAAVPALQPYTVSSGSATWTPSGATQATVNASDRAVLNWGTSPSGPGTVTNFNIQAGDSFNFVLPSGGSVLNKVTAGSLTTTATDGVAAIINGSLTSNGRVFVLANGNINVGDGASISVAGGLVLSTIAEPSDLTYLATGDLSYAGTSTSTITIGDGVGGGVAAPAVVGNLNAWSNSVDVKGATIVGNVVIRSVGSTNGLSLSGVNPTLITGNLTATTTNGTISQGAGGLKVTSNAVLSAGTAGITLTNAANDFGTLRVNSTSNVMLADANNIALGDSSVGNLNLTAVGNITTSGAVATKTTASLASTGAGRISYATGSSAGTINAATNNGSISIDTVGNVTVGTVTAGGPLRGIVVTNAGGNYTAAPTITVSNGADGAVGGGSVAGPVITATTNSGALAGVTLTTAVLPAVDATYTSNPTVTISGGGTEASTAATVTASLNATSIASITVTGGGNYSVAPTVTISGTATGSAVLGASGNLVGITLTSNPATQTGTPTITLSGGKLGAHLTGVNVPASTQTYTTAPTVNFPVPADATLTGSVARKATGVVNLDSSGKITSITITDPGSGYTGSTVTATLSGGITTVGADFGSLPTLTATVSSTHVAPLVTATLSPTAIASLTVSSTSSGSGYVGAAPTLTISAQQAGGTAVNVPFASATATVTGSLLTVNSVTSGAGVPTFTGTPAITITGGGSESSNPASAVAVAGSAVSINSSGTVTAAGTVFGSSIAVTAPAVSVVGPTTTYSSPGNIGGTTTGGVLSTNGAVTINSTGNVTLPSINAGSATLIAVGDITQGTNSALVTRTGSNLAVTAANATLTSSTNKISNNRLVLTGGNIAVTNGDSSGLQVGPTVTSGNLTLVSGGNVVFGTGGGTLSEAITVGGVLNTQVSGSSVTAVTYNNTTTFNATASRAYIGDLSSVTATFTPAPAGGVTATGRPTFDTQGRLTGVTITNPGSGYTSTPTVTISAGTRASLAPTSTNTSTISVTRTGASITDDNDVSFTVNGSMYLKTDGGDVVFDSQIGSGRGFGTFGQLNANVAGSSLTGNVTLVERTTIGVGNVSANVLTTYSTGGSIIFQANNIPAIATNTAALTTSSARANTANSSITQSSALTLGGGNHTFNNSGGSGTVLDNPANSLGGNIGVIAGANNILVSNSNISLGTNTSVTGSNRLTVTSGDPVAGAARNITVLNGGNATNVTLNASGTIAVNGGLFANLTLNATNTGGSANAITQGTTFTTVNNTLTVGAAAGAVALGTNATNTINNLVVNDTPGGVTVGSMGNITVRGNTTGSVSVLAGTAGSSNVASNYGISLGNLTASSLTLSAANGTANLTVDGSSGAITQQTGSSLSVFGNLSATTFGGNVTLTNANNNFGRIELSTGTPSTGVIALTESNTAKIGRLTSMGGATITSAFGSVVEDTVLGTALDVASLTIAAPAGSVLLGNATSTTGSYTSATANASGAVALRTSKDLSLGASSGNSLAAVSTGGNLTQSGALNVFGTSSFTAAGNITLAQGGNNFGPVSATVSNADASISISEGGSLNLRRVSMPAASSGNFTATSANGDIVDSGLGGVVLGGTTAGSGSGVVSLNAANGNIILDDPTTEIASLGGVNFTGRDVTLAVLGGNGSTALVLGSANTTSVATGNLTVSSATGSIGNLGNVTASGLATFQSGGGTINVTAAGNRFGSLRFSSALATAGNAATVAISQTGDMNILTGSSSVGGVVLSTTGNLTVSNSGGGVVSFGSTALLAAGGSITLPKLVQALGVITVNAAGTKDLSALSVAGDLGGKDPLFLGAGTDRKPSP